MSDGITDGERASERAKKDREKREQVAKVLDARLMGIADAVFQAQQDLAMAMWLIGINKELLDHEEVNDERILELIGTIGRAEGRLSGAGQIACEYGAMLGVKPDEEPKEENML